MTGVQRASWWALGVLGAGAAVGLVAWVTSAHPDGAGQAWGAVGAVAGVAAVAVSLWQLRSPAAVPPAAPAEPMTGHSGAIVTDGSVTDSSTLVTGPVAPPPAPQGDPKGISGSTGAIVARGDVSNSRTEYRP